MREALREIGAEIDLWRVAVKPGKPFLFGKRDQCADFRLPGIRCRLSSPFCNSCVPRLLQMMGATDLDLLSCSARLT